MGELVDQIFSSLEADIVCLQEFNSEAYSKWMNEGGGTGLLVASPANPTALLISRNFEALLHAKNFGKRSTSVIIGEIHFCSIYFHHISKPLDLFLECILEATEECRWARGQGVFVHVLSCDLNIQLPPVWAT